MGIPYIGHGYLEPEKVGSVLTIRYGLPWQHLLAQKTEVKGSATFTINGTKLPQPIQYEVCHLQPTESEMHLVSPDGKFRVDITSGSSRVHHYYALLVQGFTAMPRSGVELDPSYDVLLIRIPTETEVSTADMEDGTWKFDRLNPMPTTLNDITIKISAPQGGALQRWHGWKPSPTSEWTLVEKPEVDNLRDFGTFGVLQSKA